MIVANNCFLENSSQMSDVVNIISRLFRIIEFVSVPLFFLFLLTHYPFAGATRLLIVIFDSCLLILLVHQPLILSIYEVLQLELV